MGAPPLLEKSGISRNGDKRTCLIRQWRCLAAGTRMTLAGDRRPSFTKIDKQLNVSIGVGLGPQIGIQKGPPRLTFRTISVRPVGAGRGCGDGASAG